MKKYTHAWLAFLAIKRLEDANLAGKISGTDAGDAQELVNWFRRNKDGVIRGAWYPDSLIHDNANSHVLKCKPSDGISEEKFNEIREFKPLPETYLGYNKYGKSSPLRKQAFKVAKEDNLPDRCESLTESVVDHLKIQESEEKGSAVSPTDNQVALVLFMLSHYIADAHMPLHCDVRQFSEGKDIHAQMEKEWEGVIERCYKIDKINERFYYNPEGYPLSNDQEYQLSFLKEVEDGLKNRGFTQSWGGKNKNVWDFMDAVCQNSYILAYSFFPQQYNPGNVTLEDWQRLGTISFHDLNIAIFSDAIDSIARVWFRAWARYEKWVREREKDKKDKEKEELEKQSSQQKQPGGDDRIRTGE